MARKSFFATVFCLMFVLVSSIASAETWKVVSLSYAGMLGTTAVIRATDTATSPSFTDRYFQLQADASNPMLATALSALSSGKNVAVCLSTMRSWDVVTAIYMSE